MAYVDDLISARDTLAAALKANAGKPNYSIDGQSVTWGELLDRIQKLNEAINVAQGPFEEIGQAVT